MLAGADRAILTEPQAKRLLGGRIKGEERIVPGEMSRKESAAVMANATDMRPSENIHADPSLVEKGLRKGKELTAEESAAIMRLAADMRPGENFYPEG